MRSQIFKKLREISRNFRKLNTLFLMDLLTTFEITLSDELNEEERIRDNARLFLFLSNNVLLATRNSRARVVVATASKENQSAFNFQRMQP